MIKDFEAEQNKKGQPKSSQSSKSGANKKSARSSSGKKTKRLTRTTHRNSSGQQNQKDESSFESASIDNEGNNGFIEKKSNSKRSRKSTIDTETASSVDSFSNDDILETAKLDGILDVRRNKKIDTVEYFIQVKKIKKPVWVNSDRLIQNYTQQVINFLEDKYV